MPGENIHPSLRILAPAKLNLHLELLGRREDGYHDLDTVMVAIDLYDEVTITARSDETTSLTCTWLPHEAAMRRRFGPRAEASSYQLPADDKNLGWRTIQEFRRVTGFRTGVDVEIRKRIPMGAGLGGASADAAAIIVGLTRLSQQCCSDLNVSDALGLGIAANVGSDVAFLTRAANGQMSACRALGRGERLEPLKMRADLCFVLLYPPHPVSTKSVYGQARIAHPLVRSDMITATLTTASAKRLFNSTHNRLKASACELEPEIIRSLERLRRAGALHAEMTGSGSTCFAIVSSMAQARCMARRLQGEGAGLAVPARSIGVGFS
jgi:4-diphosphocytidyl-2-C-methyl-D-erythritol kinase